MKSNTFWKTLAGIMAVLIVVLCFIWVKPGFRPVAERTPIVTEPNGAVVTTSGHPNFGGLADPHAPQPVPQPAPEAVAPTPVVVSPVAVAPRDAIERVTPTDEM